MELLVRWVGMRFNMHIMNESIIFSEVLLKVIKCHSCLLILDMVF